MIQKREFKFLQTEGAFSQPNSKVCEHMIEWAMKLGESNRDSKVGPDLLELYCGGGTFTVPMSTVFRKVS